MQKCKIILGFICATQSLHAMEAVREEIDKAIEDVRKNNNYDATIVPKGFDSKNWGEINRFDEELQYAFTHIGNVYHYDTAIEDDKPIGWHCIYQNSKETPKTFEQLFNTAAPFWRQNICFEIEKNSYPNFAYNKFTKTCICSCKTLYIDSSFNQVIDYSLNELIIKQNENQENIQTIGIKGSIEKIACNNDGQYCAYGIKNNIYLRNSYSIYYIKILKRSFNGLYEHIDNSDMLTKGDNKTTQAFDLMKEDTCIRLKLENLQFLHNNSIQVHTVIPFYDKDYLWTITPEGIKTKKECFIDLGNNQLCSLAKIYNLPTLYKKVSKSPSRYSINDPRFLAFIKIEKDRNNNIVQEEKINLPTELYAKILHTWYEVDPTLRENTTLIYDSNNLSEQDKHQLKRLRL